MLTVSWLHIGSTAFIVTWLALRILTARAFLGARGQSNGDSTARLGVFNRFREVLGITVGGALDGGASGTLRWVQAGELGGGEEAIDGLLGASEGVRSL